ncbi:hypothetical protein MHYP_G00249780 [Metynnis hypsauchen]
MRKGDAAVCDGDGDGAQLANRFSSRRNHGSRSALRFKIPESDTRTGHFLKMFCGYQEQEEYEDELYHVEDEEGSSLSEPDSELEFQLYSQLHYVAEGQGNQENRQDHTGSGSAQEQPQKEVPQTGQRKRPAPAEPPEVIVIDSGPDIILLSDTTETEDSVCTTKGRKSQSCTKMNSKKVLPHPSSHPSQRKALKNVAEEVVVVESGSDDGSDSDSVPPFVANLDLDSDSDSDSDVLENWMMLGRGKEEGDQDIQLNLLVEANSDQLGCVEDGGDPQNWAVSDKDREAQIFNKGAGPRRWSNRYYMEKTVTCNNCEKTGHLSKNCRLPKKLLCCSLCGTPGHFVKVCPNRHCSNCSLPGHTFDDCFERAYWHKCCRRCGMIGHFCDACPDIWRQYHITTVAGLPVKAPNPKAKTPGFCYNCSSQGHFGHECMAKRMFRGTYPTLPFVSFYDTHRDLQCLENRVQKQVQEMQNAGLIEQPEEAVYTPQPPRKKQKHNLKNTIFSFMPSGLPPKKRIAHTPKHHPPATPKVSAQTPAKNTTPIQQLEGKKKKKKKKNNNNNNKNDVDQEFPRGFQKSPHSRAASTPPCGVKGSPAMLFSSGKGLEKSNKKKNKLKKWARKAANDKNHEASDENLFLIKQRKRSR